MKLANLLKLDDPKLLIQSYRTIAEVDLVDPEIDKIVKELKSALPSQQYIEENLGSLHKIIDEAEVNSWKVKDITTVEKVSEPIYYVVLKISQLIESLIKNDKFQQALKTFEPAVDEYDKKMTFHTLSLDENLLISLDNIDSQIRYFKVHDKETSSEVGGPLPEYFKPEDDWGIHIGLCRCNKKYYSERIELSNSDRGCYISSNPIYIGSHVGGECGYTLAPGFRIVREKVFE